MQQIKTRPLAVLIDCQNISPTHARVLFENVAGLGRPLVKRVYGDGHNDFSGWKKTFEIFGIQPVQQIGCVPGKNCADMSLVIDGMDLLHSGHYAGFCIVSNDSDFTALAMRMRAAGAVVYGFGQGKRPDGFASACDSFTLLDAVPIAAAEFTQVTRPIESLKPVQERAETSIYDELKAAFTVCLTSNGWAHPSHVLKALGEHRGRLGPGRFLKVLRATGWVDVKIVSNTEVYVRLKSQTSAGGASR